MARPRMPSALGLCCLHAGVVLFSCLWVGIFTFVSLLFIGNITKPSRYDVAYTNHCCLSSYPSFAPSFPPFKLGNQWSMRTMTVTPGITFMSTESIRAVGRHFDDVTALPLRPSRITEADVELLGWDNCQQLLDIPPCIQERMILRGLHHRPKCKSRPILTLGPCMATQGAEGTLTVLSEQNFPVIQGYSAPVPSSSSRISSLSGIDTELPGEAKSSMSLPLLSHGSSAASSPGDADDPTSSGKQSTPQTAATVPTGAPAASLGADGPSQSRRGAKRARPPSDVMSSDRDSQPSRPRRQRTEDRPRVILACPFYKWDPARYKNCRRILLTKISYVKQHILRAHRMPPHCQICNESFQTDDQMRQHIRSMTCERRPYTPPDGVTEDQIFQLRSRVNQKNSLENQWYEVFDIIFPGSARPASVFLDPELSQDLDEFVNFLTTHGPKIILDKINLSNTPPGDGSSSRSTPSLTSGLSKALQEVYDRWYRSRVAEEGASSLPKPLASGNTDHALPRPSPRSVSSMTSRNTSLAQHETSFALGGSEGYGELAPFRLPPQRPWDTRVSSSPLAIQPNSPNPGPPEFEPTLGRERDGRRSDVVGNRSPPNKG
ncbi:hypothetical protein VUR80DRAFT_6341 [Thermomyces stellatus]